MNLPKVSIQIPCYRQEKEILRAVRSALDQDYPNLEVVVCDDKSPDDTYQIACSLKDPRLQVHQNLKNMGRVANYRRLLYELSSGEWTVNLDGDDWFTDPQFISRAISLLQQYPDAVFYHANQKNLRAIARHCETTAVDAHTLLVDGTEFLSQYHHIRRFNHLSTIFNRKLAMEADFYGFDSLNADFTSIMRLCPLGKILQSDLMVGCWNLNAESASMSFIKPQQHANNLKAIDGLVDWLGKYLTEVQCASIRKSLYSVQQYYFNQAMVLFTDRGTAHRHLLSIAAFSRDYFLILAMYLYKRVLKRN